MPFPLLSRSSLPAIFLVVIGTLAYFACCLAIILAPDSPWSTSPLRFTAPAYSPLLWLLGIARLGRKLFRRNLKHNPSLHLVHPV